MPGRGLGSACHMRNKEVANEALEGALWRGYIYRRCSMRH